MGVALEYSDSEFVFDEYLYAAEQVLFDCLVDLFERILLFFLEDCQDGNSESDLSVMGIEGLRTNILGFQKQVQIFDVNAGVG